MKLTFVPFLPLLLIACVTDERASQPPPAVNEPTAAPQAMSKVEPPAPSLVTMPTPAAPAASGAPTASAPPVVSAQTSASSAPGTATVTSANGAQAPAKPAPVAPPQAAATAPKPPAPGFQAPAPAPLPVPVVLGPDSKVDPHSLSGKNLGGPIHVFGKTIEEQELRRYLCYGIGSKQLDSMKFGVMCDQEIAKRKAAGEDISQLVVSDAEFDKALEKTRKDFLQKYPTLDFPIEVGRAFLSLDIYKVELRRTMLFDKVFFPEDPAKWPSVTVEAVILASNGRAFVDDSIESYAARKQMQIDQKLEDLPPEDPILVDTLRSWLLESLNQFAVVESDLGKLPPDTLMIVEGVPVKTAALWNMIEPYVTWENVADMRRFLTQMAVAEHDLVKRDMLISQEEFEKNFTPNVPYKDALSNYEMVAIVLYGFPSMQADIRYERLLRSYLKLIADELATDDKLMPYMQRANLVAGASKIDAEVILASAYDYGNSRWKADGWKSAEAKGKELKQKLDSGANWGDLLELYSEFWDPPMPEVGQKPQFGFKFKGRFGEQTRNQFVGDLDESEFTMLLRGKSVADEIFFDQKVGSISDLYKGSRGYYIARVNSRKPGNAGLNLQAPANRQYVVNFIAMNRFGAYSRQLLADALAKGDVTGF